jgi:hypothetical protein
MKEEEEDSWEKRHDLVYRMVDKFTKIQSKLQPWQPQIILTDLNRIIKKVLILDQERDQVPLNSSCLFFYEFKAELEELNILRPFTT